MKTYLAFKVGKYLCYASAIPGTVVATREYDKHVSRPAPKPAKKPVHRYVPKPRPAIAVAEPKTAIFTADTMTAIPELCPVPTGLSGGGGSGGVGIDGDYITGFGSNLPPVGNPINVSPVPETSTWLMMFCGLFGIGIATRKKKCPSTTTPTPSI